MEKKKESVISPDEIVSLAVKRIKEIEEAICKGKKELTRRMMRGARRTSGPYKFPL